MSVLHPHVHISSTRKSASSTRMCALMTKYLFYPHVCVLPACVDHTLAPCAAVLPIFFSTPYRSHARNFITNSNFCTPFSPLDSYLNPLSDWPPIERYIFNRWPFARRSKWKKSLFWPFCAYPTRVRARKKHSPTGFFAIATYIIRRGIGRSFEPENL